MTAATAPRARFGALASGSAWPESAAVMLAGSVVMLALLWPAFDSYFFAENFFYLGKYRENGGHFWRAAFTPITGIFFRPVFVATGIPWHFLLPTEPFAYHCRNFTFAVLNLLLLQRVLLRLTASRTARTAALLFFAISKIHLTTVGYVNLFEMLVLLALELLTVLCALRYLDQGRARDWVLTWIFCTLAIFSKEYGFAVVVVLMAIVAAREAEHGGGRPAVQAWVWRFLPIAASVALYFTLRFVAGTQAPTHNPDYAPHFSLELIGRKLLLLTATLGNLAFFRDGTDGAYGISAWLAHLLPPPYTAARGEIIAYLALLALLMTTAWAGQRAGWRLLVPAIWVAAYVAPTMTVRNLQIYYNQEALVGLAIALALTWEHLGPRLRRAWGMALGLIAVNGALANPGLDYHWAFCGRQAARIEGPVLAAHRGEPLDSITFVTSAVDFWNFTIAGVHSAMLQELLALPHLEVRVVERAELATRRAAADARNLVFDVEAGFAE